jgi:hypothetical protein
MEIMERNNIKYTAVLIVACLLAWVGCAEPPTGHAGGGSERPNAPAFDGNVQCAGTTWGISGEMQEVGVTVYAIQEDSGGYFWEVWDVTATDSNGDFRIDSVEAGHYCMLFEKEGWMAFSGYLVFGADDTLVTLDTIDLMHTQNISGAIKDSAGRNSKDIILGLIGTPYYDTVTINDDGAFAFNNIPYGDYKMEITAFSLIDTVGDTTMADSNISAIDTLLVHPDMVTAVFLLINVTSRCGVAAADTTYELGYSELPGEPKEQIDSVKVIQSTIGVTGGDYSINYTVEENP